MPCQLHSTAQLELPCASHVGRQWLAKVPAVGNMSSACGLSEPLAIAWGFMGLAIGHPLTGPHRFPGPGTPASRNLAAWKEHWRGQTYGSDTACELVHALPETNATLTVTSPQRGLRV